ncbi:arginine/serine-rich protein 1 [Scomber japonicus]|uniref:arginine/serine-rich protein 1 n=1 Tax=Scomber japonicus TaxID=13676 RepID=UPI002304D16E|nr:arginine/serine-rich protein 1 [Scomber japonicus]
MAKGEGMKNSEMALARQSDGINVIFDQKSSSSSRSRSRSKSRCSYRRRYRSSSSSSNSRSSSHSRSRSHPRCHRRSSRCRCDNHRRYGRGRYRRSPPRNYRAQSRSDSHSPSPDRYSSRRHYRSRSKSSSRINKQRKTGSQFRSRVPQSPPRSHRRRPRSRSSRRSDSLTVDDKRELLQVAKANAKMLGLERLELPESVTPILSEQCRESPVSETWVRQDPEKSPSESSDVEPDAPSPKMSPKRKIISFSINNSVAKPTVAAPSIAKVTPRMDIYESRKPYGHWVPVRSRKSSNARKHTLHTSH